MNTLRHCTELGGVVVMATEYSVSCWLELESVVSFLEKLFCPLSPAEESWERLEWSHRLWSTCVYYLALRLAINLVVSS